MAISEKLNYSGIVKENFAMVFLCQNRKHIACPKPKKGRFKKAAFWVVAYWQANDYG